MRCGSGALTKGDRCLKTSEPGKAGKVSLGREQKPCLDQPAFTKGRAESWEAEEKVGATCWRELGFILRASVW